MAEVELDVRPLRKPDKHPAIFAAYDALPVGAGLLLVNNHDPKHLRDEFDTDRTGGYGWEYRERGPQAWRVLITKRASTPLPRVVGSTAGASSPDQHDVGAVWTLPARERDLDANVIHLPAGEAIGAHAGPDLDVLIHVVAGSGRLGTELDEVALEPGQLLWLPRRSRRSFAAGTEGLTYLTVHRRRTALGLGIGRGGDTG